MFDSSLRNASLCIDGPTLINKHKNAMRIIVALLSRN